jgi:hypothetical protein
MLGQDRRCNMVPGFRALICFSGAIAFFVLSIKLRKFKVSEKPPVSRASLSLEERQRKIRVAGWLRFFSGLVMLGVAILFEVLGLKA